MAIAVPIGRRRSRDDAGGVTAALYKSHGAELLRFAWHRLGRLEDAEDAVQSAFLSAHRALSDGEDVREPRAWLFRILRNECLTRIAMTKRRGPHTTLEEWHEDASPGVEEQVERRDEFDTAVALLASLPDPQRDALVLREWVGLSAIETADVIESTPQGVDALVYRARKALVTDPEAADGTTCGEVREALADGTLKARGRAHLTTCRSCRAAARRLRSPEELAAARGLLPFDAVGAGLAQIIPGFTLAAAGIAVAGGATAAAATAGSATAAGGTAAGAGTAAVASAGATAAAGTAAAGTTAVGAAAATGVAGTAAAATGAVGAGAAAGIGAKVVATVAVGAAVAGGTAVAVPPVREAIVPIVTQESQRSVPQSPTTQQGSSTVRIADGSQASGQSAGAADAVVKAGGDKDAASGAGGGDRNANVGSDGGSGGGAGRPPSAGEPSGGGDGRVPVAGAGAAASEQPERQEPSNGGDQDRPKAEGPDKPEKQDPPKAEKPDKPGKEDPPKAEKPDKPEKQDPPKAEKPDKPEKQDPPKAEKPDKPEKQDPPKAEKPDKPEKQDPPKAEKPDKPGKSEKTVGSDAARASTS
jgi:RNA polymerase sigma factor (sigma-70 family)